MKTRNFTNLSAVLSVAALAFTATLSQANSLSFESPPAASQNAQESESPSAATAVRASMQPTADGDVRFRLDAQDMDNDGNVDENEMTGDHPWRRNFDDVDVDDNGLLTLEEVVDFESGRSSDE